MSPHTVASPPSPAGPGAPVQEPWTAAALGADVLALAGRSPAEILAWALRRFPRIALVASLQVESVVLIDMAVALGYEPTVITLDTGRLPEATHEMIDRVRDRYGLPIEVHGPDPEEVRRMTGRFGVNGFYRAPRLRRLCCAVRKAHPLARALDGHDAWVTGLRRDQSATRQATPVLAVDPEHGGIAKVAPLAGWSQQEVFAYATAHDLPRHRLYDQGYTSIGCAPCTRPTRPGEDPRAGRWWWEGADVVKECGLHPPAAASSVTGSASR